IGTRGFWKTWSICAIASGLSASKRFMVPTSWRTKGLLWSAAPGCPGSKLAFGFLSVKTCFPAPGPRRPAVVVAGGVEEALPGGVIAARAGREAGPAAQVHGVPQRGAELREVPGATVLPAEVGVAGGAGDVGGVVRGADHAAGHLAGHRRVVEARRGGAEADAVGDARVARRRVEEDLAVEDGGRDRVDRRVGHQVVAGLAARAVASHAAPLARGQAALPLDARDRRPEDERHAVRAADARPVRAAVHVLRARRPARVVAEAGRRRAVVVPARERPVLARRKRGAPPRGAPGAPPAPPASAAHAAPRARRRYRGHGGCRARAPGPARRCGGARPRGARGGRRVRAREPGRARRSARPLRRRRRAELPPRRARDLRRHPLRPVPPLDGGHGVPLLGGLLPRGARAPPAGRPLLPVAAASSARGTGPGGDRRELHGGLPARPALGGVPSFGDAARRARRIGGAARGRRAAPARARRGRDARAGPRRGRSRRPARPGRALRERRRAAPHRDRRRRAHHRRPPAPRVHGARRLLPPGGARARRARLGRGAPRPPARADRRRELRAARRPPPPGHPPPPPHRAARACDPQPPPLASRPTCRRAACCRSSRSRWRPRAAAAPTRRARRPPPRPSPRGRASTITRRTTAAWSVWRATSTSKRWPRPTAGCAST